MIINSSALIIGVSPLLSSKTSNIPEYTPAMMAVNIMLPVLIRYPLSLQPVYS